MDVDVRAERGVIAGASRVGRRGDIFRVGHSVIIDSSVSETPEHSVAVLNEVIEIDTRLMSSGGRTTAAALEESVDQEALGARLSVVISGNQVSALISDAQVQVEMAIDVKPVAGVDDVVASRLQGVSIPSQLPISAGVRKTTARSSLS